MAIKSSTADDRNSAANFLDGCFHHFAVLCLSERIHLAGAACGNDRRQRVLEKSAKVPAQSWNVEREIRVEWGDRKSDYAPKLGAELISIHAMPVGRV